MPTKARGILALLAAAATAIASSCGGSEFGGFVDGGSGGSGDSSGSGSTGTGTGGSGGSGGSMGTGGSIGACTNSSVTFRLIPGGLPGSPGYCVGSCGASWVTIKNADGHVLGNIGRGCVASCSDCSPVACPAIACVAPHHLAAGGEDIAWNGTLWAQSTCTASNGNLACVNQLCAEPGSQLSATMCGFPNMTPDGGSFCSGAPTSKCVDVPFTYPTTNVVTGVLDPVR